MKLLGVLPLAKLSWNGGCLDDLYARMPSQYTIHLFNSTFEIECVY